MSGFVLGGRDEPELAVEPLVVDQVEVLGDGDLEVVDALPWPAVADELGFGQAGNASAIAAVGIAQS